MAKDTGATPPEGGRMNHDVMRRAAELPVHGPAATDNVAAAGGLEAPAVATAPAPSEHVDEEHFPGERERDTLMQSTPGIMADTGYGDHVQSSEDDTMDAITRREHAREGGGGKR